MAVIELFRLPWQMMREICNNKAKIIIFTISRLRDVNRESRATAEESEYSFCARRIGGPINIYLVVALFREIH